MRLGAASSIYGTGKKPYNVRVRVRRKVFLLCLVRQTQTLKSLNSGRKKGVGQPNLENGVLVTARIRGLSHPLAVSCRTGISIWIRRFPFSQNAEGSSAGSASRLHATLARTPWVWSLLMRSWEPQSFHLASHTTITQSPWSCWIVSTSEFRWEPSYRFSSNREQLEHNIGT